MDALNEQGYRAQNFVDSTFKTLLTMAAVFEGHNDATSESSGNFYP